MTGTVRSALRHPWTAVRKAKATLTKPLVRPPAEQVTHLDRDWDTLLLLDACRYDVFADCSTLDGQLEKVYSDASHTTDFLANNLDRPRPDTVYVSASPQLVGYEDRLHDVVHVWEDRWDPETDTVLPGDVAEVAAETAAEYPEKRLVVHFMQPHYPFLGPTAAEIGDVATFTGGGAAAGGEGATPADDGATAVGDGAPSRADASEREKPTVWDLLTAGRVSEELVWRAYRETLERALPHVERLADELTGKTVVSSDHGNLFRNRVSALPLRLSGHPVDYPHEAVLAVPWLELPFEERRRITPAESPVGRIDTRPSGAAAERRLSQLGYRT